MSAVFDGKPKSWITVNGARIPLDKDGKPAGVVGEKIKESEERKGGEGEVVAITGSELGSYSDTKELRKKAIDYYKENLQGKPARRDDIGEIRFSGKGIDETATFSANPDKLLMVPALRGIIETGSLGKEEPLNHPRKDGIMAFVPITKTIGFKGKPKDVEVLVGKDEKGNLYYDLFLDNSRQKRKKDSPVGDMEPKSMATGESMNNLASSMRYKAQDVNIHIVSDSSPDYLSSDAVNRLVEGFKALPRAEQEHILAALLLILLLTAAERG